MGTDYFTEVEGERVGRTTSLEGGKAHYVRLAGGRVVVDPDIEAAPDAVAQFDPDGERWILRLLDSSLPIEVRDIEENRVRPFYQSRGRESIVLEDSNLLVFSSMPGRLDLDTKWIFQHDEAPPAGEDEEGLYSPSRQTVLTRRKTMAIRVMSNRLSSPTVNAFGGTATVPSPTVPWGLDGSRFKSDLDHVFDLIHVDPSVARKRIRVLFKGALRRRYRDHVGDPDGRRLHELVAGLSDQGDLPSKIVATCHFLGEMTSARVGPLLDEETAPAREAHVALTALTLLLEWHGQNLKPGPAD